MLFLQSFPETLAYHETGNVVWLLENILTRVLPEILGFIISCLVCFMRCFCLVEVWFSSKGSLCDVYVFKILVQVAMGSFLEVCSGFCCNKLTLL